jgi:hypothetical protein
MKRLKRIIARFIVRCVVEDYRANGETRRVIKTDERGEADSFKGSATFGQVPGRALIKHS